MSAGDYKLKGHGGLMLGGRTWGPGDVIPAETLNAHLSPAAATRLIETGRLEAVVPEAKPAKPAAAKPPAGAKGRVRA